MHAIGAATASSLDDAVPAWQIHHRSSRITFRASYAMAATLVFTVEVAIAAFIHDALVRPYLGDSLAVVLLYLALRAVTPLDIGRSVATALAIACMIELAQWFHLADRLGIHDRLVRLMLGTGFDPADFLAYAGGAIAVVAAEATRRYRR